MNYLPASMSLREEINQWFPFDKIRCWENKESEFSPKRKCTKLPKIM